MGLLPSSLILRADRVLKVSLQVFSLSGFELFLDLFQNVVVIDEDGGIVVKGNFDPWHSLGLN